MPVADEQTPIARSATTMLVAKAMEIIGSTAEKPKVEEAVLLGMAFAKSALAAKQAGRLGALTKRHKMAAERLALALQRADRARRDADLPAELKTMSSAGLLEIEKLRQRATTIAKTKLGQPRPPNEGQWLAVSEAARLLTAHNIPLTTTRTGQFCRLAQLFYGQPGVNLYHHCCAALKGPNGSVNIPTSGLNPVLNLLRAGIFWSIPRSSAHGPS
jgi:hypothetical protein